MSEPAESNPPQLPAPAIAPPPVVPSPPLPPFKPISWWIKRLLVCNPFYLASAALLLFGLYRVSIDPAFLPEELKQLLFNFGSLQVYEILLVGTAIFLARRRIWYDSTLLVGLENLLVFVPFILISQAALIDAHLVRVMCFAGALIVVVRHASLKRWFDSLNLPHRLSGIGFVLLVMNVALPLLYQYLQRDQAGKKATWGPLYELNESAWLLILPAALALAHFLPHARETGSLWPQRRWLPAGTFALWIAATTVHLYCLGYVYDFDLRPELFAPALWVLAWTTFRRSSDFVAAPRPAFSRLLLVGPIAAVLLAAARQGSVVFFTLAALNAILYGVCWWTGHDRRFVQHLVFASVVMLLAGIPASWAVSVGLYLGPTVNLAAAVAAYLVLCTALSRDPRLAILGSVTVAVGVMLAFGKEAGAGHWALQCALVFLLLHSLSWNDSQHQGARAVRALAATLWVAHALVWMQAGAEWWMPCVPGAVALAGYIALQLLRDRWDQLTLPAAALLVTASGPGNLLFNQARSVSTGLLAVLGSFLLFGLGTVLALTRHRWRNQE